MTTYSTNTTVDSSSDANYQAWVGEVLTALYTQLGLTQTADTGQLTTSNYNASISCNAQQSGTTLTVNSISAGGNNICIGMQVVGGTFAAGCRITAFGTGTGGTGTYTVSNSATVTATSATISLKAPNAVSIQYGYTLFRFNDTLQSTLPIYAKLEFGAGQSGTNFPQMWLTVGTGSNGTGTITITGYSTAPGGTAGPIQQACGYGNGVSGSTLLNRPAYYCYNTTQGFLGMAFKYSVAQNYNTCGFAIFRSVNNSGAATADSIMCITNSTSNVGTSQPAGSVCIAANNSIFYGGASTTAFGQMTYGISWPPYDCVASLIGGGTSGMVFPVYQIAPAASTGPLNLGITNALCYGIIGELPLGTTTSITILGATSLTYISVGSMMGYSAWGPITSFGTNFTALMLYQ